MQTGKIYKGETLISGGGANGQSGLSAYELWIATGHTGTVTDFLASLKGDAGVVIDEETFLGTIVNDLTTGGSDKALSAEMGKELNAAIVGLNMDVNGGDIVYGNNTGTPVSTLETRKNNYQVRIKATDIGKTWDNAFFANNSGYFNYFIPVNGAKTVSYTKYSSTSGYGCVFLNSEEVIIGGYSATSTDSAIVTLDVPEDAAIFVWSIKPAAYDQDGIICTVTFGAKNIDPDQLPKNIITTTKIADGAVTSEKIAEGVLNDAISGESQKHYGYQLLNPSTSQLGYIVKNTGEFTALTSGNYRATDFIPVSINGIYAYCGNTYGSVGGAAVYDENKLFIRPCESAKDYTYQEGDAYVRFTYGTSGYQIICEKPAPTISGTFNPDYYDQEIIPFFGTQVFSEENIPSVRPAISQAGQEGLFVTANYLSGTSDTLDEKRIYIADWPRYIKASVIITISATIDTYEGIRIGVNRGNSTAGYYLMITSTNVSFCKYTGTDTGTSLSTSAHGLTVSGKISCVFNIGQKKFSMKMMTSDGAYTTEYVSDVYRESYGLPFIEATGNTALSDVTLRAISPNLRKPVWFVGDSYLSLYNQRWPVQLVETFGVDNYLVDGLAGGTSADMFPELNRLLALGTPRFLVWVLGMNDNVWFWRYYEKQVEMICRERGITLILQNIPEPESGSGTSSKAAIREAVAATGLRYLNAYAAVCDPNGEWHDGYCADGVHPTILGAKALAARVIVDIPEIMQ